jgi:copper resistance protein C
MINRILAVVLLGAIAISTARAHTPLASSAPAAGSAVAAPVKELVLEFGDDVRLTAVTLADSAGSMKTLADVPTAVAAKFSLAVRDELAPGDYVVTWRAVGADSHIVSGEVRFSVTAAH